ncbi:hypothetical protein SARC_08146 [Sphaeroforma arctica JP610]|uniref:Uncharacterized protein n=1 Tax=Sphaeroforma arctica JP610 TaxID=667725 RepID=A0A0L0FS88_9EUKA|nr:hypothetical protein SARC_08146 [Sphaeroforma arctica JP610]KNC79461.1 hypothetical protein SARC_08146 [Sphaeroforma arctica JP610]|eukprot:XP_014153363.1 hypothetical protein SARC_08146 [Sphaeroforma arctica JP610]
MLHPERRKEDGIDRRGTKRRQSNPDRSGPHPGQALEGQQQARLEVLHPVSANDKQSSTAHRDEHVHSGNDIVFEGETKGVPDLRADRSQTTTGEYVASNGLSTRSSSGTSGALSSSNDQPRLPPNKRRRYRHRFNNKDTVRDRSSAQKLAELMAQQQSLLEKYEQRLQRTTAERPTTRLAATETATGTHERVHTSLGSEDNLTFRIQGHTRPRHGLGYESPGSEERSTEGGETLSYIEDTSYFQEFAREQVLAKQNPHVSEALKNMQDRLITNFRQQQRRQSLEKEVASEYVQTPKPQEMDIPMPPPTPASIEKNRQALHARILHLNDELCQAIEDNNTARAEALRGAIETLRATLESRSVEKRPVLSPRTWPDWSSNKYHLHDIMEQDTRGALLEVFKNAQIAGLDDSWSLTWFHKVLSYFKAEKSTLDYIRDNSERLKMWTPQLQIEQICPHETQATVDPAFCKWLRATVGTCIPLSWNK